MGVLRARQTTFCYRDLTITGILETLVSVSNGLLHLKLWRDEIMFARSLDRSRDRSIARSLARSLDRLLDRSLARSLPGSFARSVDQLDRWLARSLAQSRAYFDEYPG